MDTFEQIENGQWGIVEIMGHKVVAGMISKSELAGGAMLRVDVPATSAYPAFTQLYGTAAIYAITFVSEEVARMTAERAGVNPVSVYVPELVTREKHLEEVTRLENMIRHLQDRLRGDGPKELPQGDDDDDPYADEDDDDDDMNDPGF